MNSRWAVVSDTGKAAGSGDPAPDVDRVKTIEQQDRGGEGGGTADQEDGRRSTPGPRLSVGQ